MNYIENHTKEYFERTYSGWLGKIIGIRMGSPIEGWTYDKIKGTYGFIDRYVQAYEDYAADDDSNGPLFFIRALLDFVKKEDEYTVEDMAETWLNYVSHGHGFFWWGGYGVSTEHTTYENLKKGIAPSQAGTIKQNGHTIAEQIGGQIFIDSWGFVKPADPIGAANLAKKMISVSHDGEALWGGAFVVACISAAYTASSIAEILEKALPVLPEDSIYRKVVLAVWDYYKQDVNKDWESCYRYVHSNFGYDKYPGNCHIIPNAALIILSLLYGDGDYAKSVYICNSCGWDTDCNAGNVGTILGVYCGINGIPDEFITPVKDLVLASSAIGYLNINTISESAELFARLGCRLADVEPHGEWKKVEGYKKYYNFNFPKSTNAIRTMGNLCFENKEGALHFCGNGEVYFKTYYWSTDLTDSRYDPSFSPLIYPGESFTFNLKNPTAEELKVVPFYLDNHGKEEHVGVPVTLSKCENKSVTLAIEVKDALVNRIGFKVLKGCEFMLHSFSIQGKVDYILDYSKEVEDNYGFGHSGLHRERSQFSYSEGHWEYNRGTLTGSCSTEAESLTGEYTLKDYTLTTTVRPLVGKRHYVLFRVEGLARHYATGFEEGKLVLLKKHNNDFTTLNSVAFDWKYNEDYSFTVTAKGDCLEVSVNGSKLLEAKDASYSFGCYGYAIYDGSRTRFKKLYLKEY